MSTGLFCKPLHAFGISLAVGHKAIEIGHRSRVWQRGGEGGLLLYMYPHCLCFYYDHEQPW